MQNPSRFIGLGVIALMMLFALTLGGKSGLYVDIPSIIMVTGILFGGALFCFPLRQIQDAFKAAMTPHGNQPASDAQRQIRIAVFGRLYLLSWGSGLIGTLVGVIAMLSDLSDPASIGMGLAVALLTAFYGACLAELLFGPMQQVVTNQTIDPDASVGTEPAGKNRSHPNALWQGTAIIAMVVSMILLLMTSFNEPAQASSEPAVEQTPARQVEAEPAEPADPSVP